MDRKDDTKAAYFQAYSEFLYGREFNKKFRKLMNAYANPERFPQLISERSFISNKILSADGETCNRNSTNNAEDLVENVLYQGAAIIPKYNKSEDLCEEDKLLLFNHGSQSKRYFEQGTSTSTKIACLEAEDVISKIALTMDQTIEHTIIAAEDTYIISLNRKDFMGFFNSVTALKTRVAFLKEVFPDIELESIVKLCPQLEERNYTNYEKIFKRGEDAHAIYLIKSGGAQVI